MKIYVRKNTIFAGVVIAALAVLLSVTLFFSGTFVAARAVDATDEGNEGRFYPAAESGSVVDYTATPMATVALNVNGPFATAQENSENDYNKNNASCIYRTRQIGRSVFQEILGGLGYTGSNYALKNAETVKLYNYFTDYFTVTPSAPESYSGFGMFEFAAVKATTGLANIPRIAFVMEHLSTPGDSEPKEITVTVEVQVNAYTPMGKNETNTTFYVGRQLEVSRKKPVTDENSIGFVDIPIPLKNYTTKEIDIEKYLLNRILYKPAGGDLEKALGVTLTPDARADLTAEQAKTAGAVLEEDQETYLAFNDISQFRISNIPTGSVIETGDVRFYEKSETDRKLKFVVDVNITKNDLSTTRFLKNGKLWGEDGVYFELTVELTNVRDNSVKLTVKVPVAFEPADDPKLHNTFVMPTSLNAGSTESFDVTPNNSANAPFNVVGYRSVRVYPEFLCDFPSYDDDDIYFEKNEVVKNSQGNSRVNVEIVPADDNNPQTYYVVTGKDNGTTDLVFTVSLSKGGSISVPVTFTVYGAYSVAFAIEGIKTRTFSIDSPVFRNLRDAGYQIVDAEFDASNAGDVNYAAVSCNNGVISITPKITVLNYNTAGVIVTLADMEGHRIQLHCGMLIDMDKGDIMLEWRTWQKVLLFGGIGLGVLLILLLVIWLFIRSAHRRKLDELETSAPTSAYIVKLNSTIAAAQAQQQRVAAQTYGAPMQMMQLGTGGVGTSAGAYPVSGSLPSQGAMLGQTALPNGAAALGVAPQMSAPAYSNGTVSPTTGSVLSTPASRSAADDIYIPISDDELLLRIYEERFEPRGMLKRTFDKSKDLQQRELAKEKARIREDVRNGMSIEEACKSLKDRQVRVSTGVTDSAGVADNESSEQVDPLLALLGFDPSEPVVADVQKEETKEDWSEEQKKLKEVEYNNLRLRAELAIIEQRLSTIGTAAEKTENDVRDSSAAMEQLTDDIKAAEQTLDDKNTDLVVTRGKAAKEALNKEIAELDARIKADKERMAKRKAAWESANGLLAEIKSISNDYAGKREATEALIVASDQELETARVEAQKAADLAERARKLALLNSQLEILNPMMHTVNKLDAEIAEINVSIESSAADKDSLKTRISALQTEMLGTTDSSRIGELSELVKSLNKEMAEIDRNATANTTLKTNKNIEMSSVRRKVNEYIDKEGIELEDVITAEDKIIGQLALDKLTAQVENERIAAEEAVARWQGECDRLIGDLDSDMAETIAASAERVRVAEESLAAAQAKLAELDAAVETCENDDDKLNLTMEQMSQQEEVNTLADVLETVRADSMRANLEFRTTGEGEVENARAELERAKAEFARATEHFNEVGVGINPLDLITSGSGVISQDRKKIEAENYKKRLEEQQKATEQARLQAQLAQEEAERAVSEAQRSSEESKAEAERMAQEALERARLAQEDAENKAREDAERAREEMEEAKRLAQEEIERIKSEAEDARRLAEEEAERVRLAAQEETERARLEAQEEAERARLEAEAKAEEARKLAEEETARARVEAEEETARVRREAEEEAERARLEAEEEKRKSEEEAEKARLAAEEEAKKLSEEEAKRKAALDEKIAKRKEIIAKLRDELKEITEEEQGNALREKFYQMQLGLDEDEKTSQELNDLLQKSMDDAAHAAELARYKKMANQKPRRIVKKVTERVNRIPKSARTGKRRPANATRRGAARPGARPTRPAGARPGAKPARPAGARPSSVAKRPSGSRPTTRK